MLVSAGTGLGYLGANAEMSIAAKALDEARKDIRGYVGRMTLQQTSILGPSISIVSAIVHKQVGMSSPPTRILWIGHLYTARTQRPANRIPCCRNTGYYRGGSRVAMSQE